MSIEEHDITVLSARVDCVAALRSRGLSSNPGAEPSSNLLFMDGAEHVRLRSVIRRVIARLEPLPAPLQRHIEDLVDGLGARGEFDLVADFAQPVAAAVTAEVLGVELDDSVLAGLEAVTANLDVWFGTTDGAADTAALRLAMFFTRATPVPGRGLAILRDALEAGEISEDEYLVTPVMLAHAAYENSLNLLALAGLRMATDPAPAVTTTMVRRLVREISPARLVLRRATESVALPGGTVPAGRTVAVRLGSDADSDSAGLAFGLGPHACPGAKVATAEAEVALRTLARVLETDHSVRDVRPKPHAVFYGLERATVTLGDG